jgi:Domain of unknown function (DUF5658)
MSRVLVVAGALFAALLSPSLVLEARAQDRTAPQPLPLLATAFAHTTFDSVLGSTTLARGASSVSDAPTAPDRPVLRSIGVESRRSPLLASLYASTAMWQALDVHSTLRILDRGGFEGNPMLAGVTQNKSAFIATKAAIAAGSIYAASRLGRRNKFAAAAALVGIDVAYALVVSHNYALARSLR